MKVWIPIEENVNITDTARSATTLYIDITGIIIALICHIFRHTLRGDCTRLDDEGDACMNGINKPPRLEKERITCVTGVKYSVLVYFHNC